MNVCAIASGHPCAVNLAVNEERREPVHAGSGSKIKCFGWSSERL